MIRFSIVKRENSNTEMLAVTIADMRLTGGSAVKTEVFQAISEICEIINGLKESERRRFVQLINTVQEHHDKIHHINHNITGLREDGPGESDHE